MLAVLSKFHLTFRAPLKRLILHEAWLKLHHITAPVPSLPPSASREPVSLILHAFALSSSCSSILPEKFGVPPKASLINSQLTHGWDKEGFTVSSK